MNIYDQVNSLSDDDLLRLCRVLTCAPGDEMKIYHSRLGGPGHQNAKEGSMIGYCPELHSEYAREKMIEQYNNESKGRAARAVVLSRASDINTDRCHTNPDERPQNIPGTAPDTKAG